MHYIIATTHLNSTEKFIFIVPDAVDALWSAIDFEIAAVKITRRLFENRAPWTCMYNVLLENVQNAFNTDIEQHYNLITLIDRDLQAEDYLGR